MTRKARQVKLRLVLREGPRLRLVWHATIVGEDVYAGPPPSPPPLGDTFRLSYHASGATHLRLEGHRVIAPAVPPRGLAGWHTLGAWSIGGEHDYQPKPDSPRRRTLVVDADRVPIPVESWMVYLFAVDRQRPELVDQLLSDHQRHHLLIAHLVARCNHATCVVLLSTFTVEDWNAAQTAIANAPPPRQRGPVGRER